MKPAAFLDRDGTLVEDGGYICDPRRIHLYPFTPEAIRLLNGAGIPVVVVTNQSAVARGICTPRQVEEVHRWLRSHLHARGAVIDAFYWCPFHPRGSVAEFAVDSPLRKPAPGMLELAAGELDLDLGKSVMIGDKLSDVAAGAAVRCRTILVRTGYGESEAARIAATGIRPHHVVSDLMAAVELWLKTAVSGIS